MAESVAPVVLRKELARSACDFSSAIAALTESTPSLTAKAAVATAAAPIAFAIFFPALANFFSRPARSLTAFFEPLSL